MKNDIKNQPENSTERNIAPPKSGSALGDTIRAVNALKVTDAETTLTIFKMLNGGR